MLWVEVTDTGPGIAQELLPRVFDRFFRANPDIEGTGLGLSIVRSITQKYGGDALIRNRSDARSGIVAAVSFPLAEMFTGFSGHGAGTDSGKLAQVTGTTRYLHGRDV